MPPNSLILLHRIGGLEMTFQQFGSRLSLLHRIGGLETMREHWGQLNLLLHRIGGLEKLGRVQQILIDSLTPHRWLRK